MKVAKKRIISDSIILLVLILIMVLYLCNINAVDKKKCTIILANLAIIVISIIEIVKDDKKFSINKCFWYFNLFFFGITPIFQYISGYFPWSYYLSDNIFEISNIMLLIWIVIYKITYRYTKCSKSKSKNRKVHISKETLNICLILSIISVIVLILLVGGVNNLFLRATNNIDLGDNLVNSIITKLVRSIPAYTVVFYVLAVKKNIVKASKIKIVLLIILTVLVNFPVSVTRYWMGTIFIGIILVMSKERMKYRWFDYLMIFIFAIAFPFSYVFKWIDITNITNITANFDISNVYNSVDFDAYSLLGRIIDYTNKEGAMLGKQLSSSAFFFIPRAIWNAKPIPTGVMVPMKQGADYINLSSPLVAEAYVDFGIIGIIIYSFIIARLIKYLDFKYWSINDKNVYYLDIIYPFLIGFSIFLFRGSLQPVVTHMFAFFLFLIIVYIVQLVVYGGKMNGKN